ncbi:MAG: hypothetical protein UDG94_07450 [Peptococcaceae bacterium]|nr:hypothetical protein [Peptococcaceae bacterium]
MHQESTTNSENHASLLHKLPQPAEMLAHLLQNWYFPFSALAYFLVEVRGASEYGVTGITLTLSFLIMLVVASQRSELWQTTRKLPWYGQLWAMLSAAGACWHCYSFGHASFAESAALQSLLTNFSSTVDLSRVLAVCCALAGFPFVYICISYLWTELCRLAKKLSLFSGLTHAERLIYAIIALALIAYAAMAFYASNGFYSATNEGYDIVYTADTDSLFNNMAYLALTFVENDLRQPLFAVFSAPFAGVPYLLTQLFQFSPSTEAVLLNTVQILMILTGNLLLTRLVAQSPLKRICFMITLSVTYTTLLNVLMLEQYVTAYFWLMLSVALICTHQKEEHLGFYGAVSALLTNVALLPWMSAHSPRSSFKGWLGDMIRLGMSFVVLLLAFARFDVIYSVVAKLASLFKFTGGSWPLSDRFKQYFAFVHDCFVSPAAHVSQGVAPDGILSWRLDPVQTFNIAGIALFVLTIVAAWFNRDKLLSRFAIYWVAFSIVLLALIGWGTWETGLVLYSLYFGWSFFVLLFQLIDKAGDALHARWLLPACSFAAAALMLWLNIPGIQALLDYCVTYFPI